MSGSLQSPPAVSLGLRLKAHGPTVLPLLFLLALIAGFALKNSAFLSPTNVFNIMRQSSVLLIVATGTTFIILQGSIDLSMGSIVTLAGITAATVISKWEFGLWGIPVAMMVGAAAGSANGFLFAYGKVPSFLVTLGALFAIDGVGLMISDGQNIRIMDRTYNAVSSGTLIGKLPNIALWALGVYLVAIIIATRTQFGRYMYAIGGGERAARLSGVPVDRFKLYSFMLAGMLSGLAGALLAARLHGGSPGMGEGLLLDSIAAVVIGGTALTGGMGGPHRTLLGVLIMGILSNGLNFSSVDPYLQIIIKGTIVVVAVFLTIDRSKIDIMK